MPPVPVPIILEAVGYKEKGSQMIDLTWNVTDAYHVDFYRNGRLIIPDLLNDGEQTIRGSKGNDGVYTFQVCEVGYNNCSDEITVVFGSGGDDGSIEPPNESPVADFNWTTESLFVSFTDTSTDPDGSIISWNWDFGDGNSSTVQNPEHLYADSGTYNVSLTVTDDAGATGSTSQNVSVSSAEEPQPGDILLTANGYKVKGSWHTDLSWSPSGTSDRADIYRNGNLVATTGNTGSFTDATGIKGGGSLTYKICESGTTTCSNEVTVQF